VSVGVTHRFPVFPTLSVPSQAERRPKSAADKKAEELLMRLDMESQGGGRKRAKDEPRGDDKASHGAHAKLLGQLEEAERIMMDRDHTVKQLEQRLEAKSNECERHQANCGRSIEEIKAMKQVRHVIMSMPCPCVQRPCRACVDAPCPMSTIGRTCCCWRSSWR